MRVRLNYDDILIIVRAGRDLRYIAVRGIDVYKILCRIIEGLIADDDVSGGAYSDK